MKLKDIKFALLGLLAFSVISCETMDDVEPEYSPIWPLSGEWLTYVYQADGVTKVTSGLFALRTYNTSDNVADKAWIRLGSTQTYAIWGKVDADVAQKTISGATIANNAKANTTFTIQEGKVLLQATTVPSGVTADSIYVRYTTTADNQTYIVKGHRRTRWDPTE